LKAHGREALFALALTAASILVAERLALADGRSRVLVLGPSERDPIVVRLRRELGLLGLEVELLTPGGDDPHELAESAKARHAVAAAAVRPSPPGIVLWIDPALHPSTVAGAEVRVDDESTGAAEPRLLALRAVEILRERLLPVAASPPPAPEDAPAASPTGAAPAVPTKALRIQGAPSVFIGPAVVASPGNLGAMASVWLGARWAPIRRMDLELVALLPTVAATASAAEGSMTFRAGALAAGVSAKLTEPASDLFVDAGAGLGLLVAGYEGQARPPWQSAGGVRATMLPYAHASLGYWVAARVALRADVLMGFALPQPVLTIAGHRVAAFGEPAAVFSAGIEVRP
jgi:hypothetical protein